MSLQRGSITELSKKLDVSPSHLSDIFNRRVKASPKLAVKLEEHFGIDRRAWVWPDEFENRLLPADPSPRGKPRGVHSRREAP